jgi:trimethylamine--corrinoid protein Co-methyltransferase
MPLMGATAPATFIGALVQHTAENLSGVVLAQATREGAPVIYGGSPAVFDMRYGTTPMGAIETMMLDSAYAQIGKHFGLPTHAYMELSDSRWVDYQGGLESGIGAFMAALAGINMVSGAGMMDFESCQSFEKLVLDNEICGMALHMLKGINPVDDDFGFEELAKYAESGDFLKSPATRKHFRSQQYFPSKVIERSAGTMGTIESDAYKRAHQQVEALLSSESDILQSPDLQEIEQLMLKEAQKCGFNELLKNC